VRILQLLPGGDPLKKKTKRDNSSAWDSTGLIQFSGNPMTGVFEGMGGHSASLSQPLELAYNNSYYFISLNRVLCTYAYTLHGVLRTLVDQPVNDAFRGGLTFKSDELDEDDKELLTTYVKKHLLKPLRDSLRWDRLYGGAGLIVNTNSNYSTPLNKEKVNENSKLEFIAADRWELVMQGGMPGMEDQFPEMARRDMTYDYYGRKIDPSRVYRIVGEEAPALARRRLQGWGMSVIECVLREINQYLKNQNVLFELLDEAKIDVYKLKDFNSKVLSKLAEGKIVRRITIANAMKNFANAIMLDSEDEYEQKQLTLTGIADTLVQIRIGIAAAVRMPVTKLFGLSAAGFNSGEDDLENYNTLVEHERERAEEVLDRVLPLVCRKLFGYEPVLEYEWKPLRILSAIDEENVKTGKFNRLSTLFSQGMLTDQEYAEALKQEGILTMSTEVLEGTREAEPPASPSLSWDQPMQPKQPGKVTEAT
jgi:uncharacterized protein